MTVLIEVRGSHGVKGRCDAKCYDAEHPECDCVCGGRNHGEGFKQAQTNTEEVAGDVIKKYKKDKVVFSDKGKQLELFNE